MVCRIIEERKYFVPCCHSPLFMIETMQQKVRKHRLNPSTQARQSAQKQKILPMPLTEQKVKSPFSLFLI